MQLTEHDKQAAYNTISKARNEAIEILGSNLTAAFTVAAFLVLEGFKIYQETLPLENAKRMIEKAAKSFNARVAN